MPGVLLIIIALMVGAISGVFQRVPNQKNILGEIVSIERKQALESGKAMYTAYVEYYIDGVPYVIRSKFKSSSFRSGQKVRVVYNQKDPQQAIVRPSITAYVVMLVFLISGVVILLFLFLK